MHRWGVLMLLVGAMALSLACDVGNLAQQVLPAPTQAAEEVQPSATATSTTRGAVTATATAPALAGAATPTSTAVRGVGGPTVVPTAAATTRAVSTPVTQAAPLPAGWQLVKYSKDESCSLGVPPDWKVDARISSALKTDAQFTNGTVSVALANTTDWDKFKKTQSDVRSGDKVVENSASRLVLEGVGDGKTTQAGSLETYLAIRNADGRICVSIMGTDGKAAASWRDVFTQIAKTVAFR